MDASDDLIEAYKETTRRIAKETRQVINQSKRTIEDARETVRHSLEGSEDVTSESECPTGH